MVLEECSPGLRGRLCATGHETGNGPLRDVEPQLDQLAVDARRTPERIGQRHAANELCKLPGNRWPTGPSASGLPRPEGPKALAVPANHRLRPNDVQRLTPPCPPLREPEPEDTIERAEPRSPRAAAEQGELLSERKVLERKVALGLERCAQGPQQSEYEAHCHPDSLRDQPPSTVTIEVWHDRVLPW